ncbi:MAG: hypothetical protein WBZ22_09025, partial [Pseudolabrys sp.]
GPAGKFLALISVECQQFWKSQQGQWLMVNGDVMGQGLHPSRYPKRPARGMPSGLLAGRFLCCYCLDFKQLVYLFRLQW